MKLVDQVKNLKLEYPSHLIIIKGGMFYVAYSDDAYILNYLLDYQLNDDKVGFPSSGITKVLNKLEENTIDVYVKDDNVINKEYPNNNYQQVLYKAKKNYFNELNAKLLLEEISFLLENNPENIYKIKAFINEL